MFNIRRSMSVALAMNDMSMNDLADKMNKCRSTLYSSIYNGNPTLCTVSEIAKEFNLELSDFIKLGE